MKTEDILKKYPEEIKDLTIATQKILFKELPDCMEMPDASANVIGFGYSNKYADTICTIILSKKGVKLGFYKGSELPDPCHLLTGTGKVHKYVQLNNVADLKNPEVRKLVKEGYKAWKKRSKK